MNLIDSKLHEVEGELFFLTNLERVRRVVEWEEELLVEFYFTKLRGPLYPREMMEDDFHHLLTRVETGGDQSL